MPDSQPLLSALFAEAFRTLAPKRAVPEVDVRYYPYAGLQPHHPAALGSLLRPPVGHLQERAR